MSKHENMKISQQPITAALNGEDELALLLIFWKNHGCMNFYSVFSVWNIF